MPDIVIFRSKSIPHDEVIIRYSGLILPLHDDLMGFEKSTGLSGGRTFARFWLRWYCHGSQNAIRLHLRLKQFDVLPLNDETSEADVDKMGKYWKYQ